MKLALAQINPTVGDLKGNVARIGDFTARAREAGAGLVVFPELALCGYPPEDLLLRQQFVHDCGRALDDVVGACRGINAIIGFPGMYEGRVYNAAAVVLGGGDVPIYRKRELPNYGVFDEKRYFAAGDEPLTVTIGGVRIAITICEDIWVRGNAVERQIADGEVDLVVNVSASPFQAGKSELRRKTVFDFARATGTPVCYCNVVGGQDELVFDGGSTIVAPDGTVTARAAWFEEQLLVAGFPPGKAAVSEPLPEIEQIRRALVLGTRDYVRKNGFRKVLIGLSGGIDSALTAAIAVDALGTDDVVGVTMPSRYTSEGTRTDAETLAENLGIRLITLPIEPVFTSYVNALRAPFEGRTPDVTEENLQARVRGNLLMALSNKFGWLVLTTGNKSETAVGYCTLYGDMAGGFAVIKDVPKTTVYALAAHVNASAGCERIPATTIERPPSAELREDQKDEDSLPPYSLLDRVLEMYVERDMSPEEIAAEGIDETVAREVARMVDRNEYKRRQAPPGVKITPKAFGRDRRLPMTNRYGRNA